MAKGIFKFCPWNHYKAIVYRRLIMYKRSVKTLILTLIGIAVFSVIGIAMQYLMISLMEPSYNPINYDAYNEVKNDFLFTGNLSSKFSKETIDLIISQYRQDTGGTPSIMNYSNIDDAYKELFEKQLSNTYHIQIPFGVDYESDESPESVVLLYNATTNTELESADSLKVNAHVLFGDALLKLDMGPKASIVIGFMKMNKSFAEMIFSMIGPMLIVCGCLTIISLVITQPVADIRGDIRNFMVQCNLKITPYWLATFSIDIVVWIILSTITWAIYSIGQVKSAIDNIFNIWYILVFQGPSYILFLYVFSFLFKDANSAARQTFLIFIVIMLIPMVLKMVVDGGAGLNWVYSLIPHVSLMQLLGNVMVNTGSRKQTISYYWKDEMSFPMLIMQWIDILIYGFILFLIEKFRHNVEKKLAKRTFGNYTVFLRELKAKHETSEETERMEEEVLRYYDWAVRVEGVSRLFINTAGNPVPAVNCVTLGVKKNSIFGFLGANGAGKTTLIRMITGTLPVSDGNIEIFGQNIDDIKDRTILSICPQFNTHLCFEMTAREHFHLYGLLFEMEDNERREISQKLMESMELLPFLDTPISDLSAGDVRKLAIALSFFGPSKIVLLDEPTANLDPVACKCVHQMILDNKGSKTFMLCTHLLSEAEELCDMISIMVKGNVFTVGSPQYLTKKFGTEYKIDIKLNDDSEESETKCNRFFLDELPEAVLTVKRPDSRIYSIPADAIQLSALFQKMQKGANSHNAGFEYYTCSSSSLERVFMEIVRKSEEEDAEQEQHEALVQQTSSNLKKKSSMTMGRKSSFNMGKKAPRISSRFEVSESDGEDVNGNLI